MTLAPQVVAELELERVAEDVYVRSVLAIDDAIDLYLGDLARAGRKDRTRDTYGRHLQKFADTLPRHWDVAKITPDDCRRYLDRYNRHSDNYRFQIWSILHCLFDWLYGTEQIKRSPMDRVMPPRKPDPLTLDVVTVTGDEAARMLAECRSDTERLSVGIPALMGCRRRAAAQLKVKDYDRARGKIRFQEKGGKIIWKPVPAALAVMLECRKDADANDYLIPGKSKQRKDGSRDDRVVYFAVKKVAERAGVESHVHALRAAFAVQFDDTHPDRLLALKDLMGHKQLATTEIYLRRRDKARGMEVVRDLTYQIAGKKLGAESVTEKEGFEPSIPAKPLPQTDCTGQDILGDLLQGLPE